MKKNAFTLIELLVALSVIAILAFIALASYDSLTKNARDGQRKADLKTIQSALEQYYRDQLSYPSDLSAFPPGGKYLKQLPTEAVAGSSYNYVQSGTSYCLYATMEQGSNAGFVSSTCNDSSKGNYSISSP